jgi:hypothetical protein
MVYDENSLNSIKGRIGELVYALFLEHKYCVICEDPDLQKKGIDWRIKDLRGPHFVDIDVKLSDKLEDYFSIFYRNEWNIRMPFKKGCSALWLSIVTFDWKKFCKDNNVNADGDELQVARDLRDNLQKAYDKVEFYDFLDLIVNRYVISIIDIKTQIVVGLCAGFAEKNPNESNADSHGQIVATRRDYGKNVIAEVKWSAIPEDAKIVHYTKPKEEEVLPTLKEVIDKFINNPACKIVWPFSKSKSILINEKGKTLLEMSNESIEWIYKETLNSKSTFHKTFKLDKEEFQKLIQSFRN